MKMKDLHNKGKLVIFKKKESWRIREKYSEKKLECSENEIQRAFPLNQEAMLGTNMSSEGLNRDQSKSPIKL